MKPWIKFLIAGIVGFGGGFAAGFFAHKKMTDVQFEEISEEEMKEIEQAVENSKEEAVDIKEKIERAFDPARDIPKDQVPTDPDDLRKTLQGKTSYIQADKELKTAYEKLWNATKEYSNEENANNIPIPIEEAEDISPGDDDDFNLDEGFLEMIENEEVDPGSSFVEPPHVISLPDFYGERPDYDKITIDWYEPDDTWLDEKEEVIADISSYVGNIDVRKLFAENTADDDPDVRFIRNDQYGTDYEIIRHHRSWIETNGGV